MVTTNGSISLNQEGGVQGRLLAELRRGSSHWKLRRAPRRVLLEESTTEPAPRPVGSDEHRSNLGGFGVRVEEAVVAVLEA
jgi:hypothetical protein